MILDAFNLPFAYKARLTENKIDAVATQFNSSTVEGWCRGGGSSFWRINAGS
jgi:hypothetical protein